LIERSVQPLSKPHRIVMGPEVHVEEARLVGERMMVDGRHRDAVVVQGARHRIHF
jgi:hypothetical protein